MKNSVPTTISPNQSRRADDKTVNRIRVRRFAQICFASYTLLKQNLFVHVFRLTRALSPWQESKQMSVTHKKVTAEPMLSARRVRVTAVVISVAFSTLGIIWAFGLVPGLNSPPRSNSIMTVQPYRHNGTWVFDDLSAGLVQEPFVVGVPEMINFLVSEIPNSESGFRMLFSAHEFPGYQYKLTRDREEMGGNYYKLDDPDMEGWVCPAMFKYFKEAPPELYVKAEPLGT